MECLQNAGANIAANASCTEMLALEIEIGNLIQRIDSPEPCIEFDAVDNLNIVSEPDMLRPQVAVPVDNAPLLQAIQQHRALSPEKLAQHRVALPDQPQRKSETGIHKYCKVLLKIEFPLIKINLGP